MPEEMIHDKLERLVKGQKCIDVFVDGGEEGFFSLLFENRVMLTFSNIEGRTTCEIEENQ